MAAPAMAPGDVDLDIDEPGVLGGSVSEGVGCSVEVGVSFFISNSAPSSLLTHPAFGDTKVAPPVALSFQR